MFQHGTEEIFYQVFGPDDGPVVLFSHGVTMDHRTFLEQAEALSDRYRVVLWDLPGHGKSSPIEGADFRLEPLGDALVALLDELGVEQATLVGQSVSSLLHQHVAFRFPARVKALVDIGGMPLHRPVGGVTTFFGKAAVGMTAALPEKTFYGWFANARAIKDSTREYLAEGISKFGKKKVLEMTYAYLEDQSTGIPQAPPHRLLIINGEEEIGIVKKASARWAEGHHDAERVIVSDAGHIANQDNPGGVFEVLRPYLDSLSDVDE